MDSFGHDCVYDPPLGVDADGVVRVVRSGAGTKVDRADTDQTGRRRHVGGLVSVTFTYQNPNLRIVSYPDRNEISLCQFLPFPLPLREKVVGT